MVLACGRQKPFERFVAHWMKSYEVLFKVPLAGAGAAAADGVRDTDEFFMRSIDALVDQLLEEMKVPHERLPAENREGWIDRVREVVVRRPEMARLF
jgi:hypothetical protein